MESGNHYVAQVKRNQKTLFEEIERTIVEQAPIDGFEVHESGHGRSSSWYAFVYDAQQNPKAQEWTNLRRFIHVHRIREEKGKTTHTDSFYISDLFETSAEVYQQGTRGHWAIENRLHWVKDVFFNEDQNRIRTGAGPIVDSILSAIAINIHRSEGRQSIIEAQAYAVKNIRDLICTIRT